MKKIILSGVAVFGALCSTCYALEESPVLLFAMAVGKTLMTAQQPYAEVASTEAIYLREGNAHPLHDTQCTYSGIEGEQRCFGNSLPTRIRFQPNKSLKLGLAPQSISQVKNNTSFSPPTPDYLPDQIIFPEFDSVARAIATEIQQGAERQYEITQSAKQTRRLWLVRSSEARIDGVAGECEEEEDETTVWWALEEDLHETDDSDEAKVRYENLIDDGIHLKPDTSYCIPQTCHNISQLCSDALFDGEGANRQ